VEDLPVDEHRSPRRQRVGASSESLEPLAEPATRPKQKLSRGTAQCGQEDMILYEGCDSSLHLQALLTFAFFAARPLAQPETMAISKPGVSAELTRYLERRRSGVPHRHDARHMFACLARSREQFLSRFPPA